MLIFDNNPKPLESYGVKVKLSKHSNPYMRYLDYAPQIKDFFGAIKEHKHELENFERLQTIERLESLYRLQSDYQDAPIPKGALIYCDPPYAKTNCGKYDGFDSERFYEWADKQNNIFISEYTMPTPFIPIAHVTKTVLSASNGNAQKSEEYLFTNERTWAAFDDDTKQLYRENMAKQMCFW